MSFTENPNDISATLEEGKDNTISLCLEFSRNLRFAESMDGRSFNLSLQQAEKLLDSLAIQIERWKVAQDLARRDQIPLRHALSLVQTEESVPDFGRTDDLLENANEVFHAEVARVKHNVKGGHITPRLASALLEHFGRALSRVTNNKLEYLDACEEINPDHQTTMLAYRVSKPADLALETNALERAKKACQ